VHSEPAEIKVWFKGINSQEDPKCIELDENFIISHNFNFNSERLKVHITDDNIAYLYYYNGGEKSIIEIKLTAEQITSIPMMAEGNIRTLRTNKKFIVVATNKCTYMIDRD